MSAIVPLFVSLSFLAVPVAVALLGSRAPVRRVLVPRGAPARIVTAVAGLGMFAGAWALVETVPDSASDNAWLIVSPAVFALGLCGLGFGVASILRPAAARAAATSGVILVVLVLTALNIAMLSAWAASDDEDLNGNALRPPVTRAVVVLGATAVGAFVVGQLRRRGEIAD